MIEVNLYKVKAEIEDVYYKGFVYGSKEDFVELKRFAYKNNGVFFQDRVYSLNRIGEKIDFNILPDYIQEQLVLRFLKGKNFFTNLSKKLKNLEKESYRIIHKIVGSVFKIDRNFYVALDIRREIDYKKSFLEEIDEDIKEVKDLHGRVGRVERILFQKDSEYLKEFEKLKNYFRLKKQEYRITSNPIVVVDFGNQKFSYFANELKRYMSVKDLKEDFRLSNIDRKKLIESLLEDNELVENKAFRVKSYKFKWVKLKGKRIFNFYKEFLGFSKISPKRVPEILRDKIINVYVFVDETLKSKKSNYINRLYKRLKSINGVDFKLVNRDIFVNLESEEIYERIKSNEILPLVILVGRENQSYYEDVKKRLFSMGFISQNVLYESLLKAGRFEIDNLVLQIMVKYGLYPYGIEYESKYDYIVGVDVGNDRYGKRRIAGGISVMNRDGVIEKIIPIKVYTDGEKIDMGYLFEEMSKYIDIKRKILILRDGKLSVSERESILKFKDLDVTFMSVIKSHPIRIYDDSGQKGAILRDSLGLVLSHSIKGAKALKIETKVECRCGEIKEKNITKEDLELIYALSRLNYSNVYISSKTLRLPAPIHYSDKFVKALGRDWEIDKRYLLDGFLYFL